MNIKRWNFICSYTGILTAGLGIFAIALIISLIVHVSFKGADPVMTLGQFPAEFLAITFPVIIIQTFFLLISNIVLIVREGMGLKRLLGFAAGAACVVLNYFARPYLFTALIACYLECVSIGISVMSIAAVYHKPSLDNDYLIILGCSIGKDGKLLPLIKNRVNRAIRFAWEQEIATGKSICYVPSGGQGMDEVMSEGDAMSLYLLSHSAESYEVMSEMNSRNTYENFVNSKKLIDEHDPDAHVVYVTTNYHVLRSGMLARRAGLHAEGLSSTTKWYFWPNGFIREMIAIMVMYPKAQICAVCICILLTLLIHTVII